MNCTKCGAEILEGSKFCSGCGAAAPAPVPQTHRCANCGTELTVGETFCSNCGARQEAAPAGPPPAAPPGFGTAPPPSQPSFEAAARPGPSAPPQAGFGQIPRPAGPPPPRPGAGGGYVQAAMASTLPAVQFKGIGPRFAAAVIDTVLYFALAWLVSSRTGGSTSSGFELQGVPFLLTSVVWAAYYILAEGYLGGTLSKLVLGMRVVNARGSAPGPVPALIRNALRVVDFLPLLYLLGILLVTTSKEKQRFGDRVAGTFVVSSGGAKAVRAAGAELKGAGGTPLVLALVVLLLAGGGYLLWGQSGPIGQVAGAFSGLPVLGGLIPKQAQSPDQTRAGAPATPTAVARATLAPTTAAAAAKSTATATPTAVAKATPVPTAAAKPTAAATVAAPSGSATSGTGLSQNDLKGTWRGSIAMTSFTADGMSAADKEQFEAAFKAMQGNAQTLEITIDPKANDSGSITMSADGDPLGPLTYKYQNGKMTFDYQDSSSKGSFEGYTNRKGSGFSLDGTMKVTGQESGASITMIAAWTATK